MMYDVCFLFVCVTLCTCARISMCALSCASVHVCMYSQRPEEGTEAAVTGSFELVARCGPPSVGAGKQT